MKRIALVCALMLAAVAPAFGQATSPSQPTLQDLGFSSFSVTASAVAIHGASQTVAATDLGQALAVTPNFSLRADEILSPTNAGFTSYLGGFKYFLPNFKPLANTNLAPLQFYVTGDAGISRVTPTGATAPVNHLAALVGGGANWNPKATGSVSFNLFEVRYARLPGFQNNAMLVSSGVKVSW